MINKRYWSLILKKVDLRSTNQNSLQYNKTFKIKFEKSFAEHGGANFVAGFAWTISSTI